MHDYPGEKSGIDKKIRNLQGRLNRSTNEFTRKSLVDELGRLEQERLHGDNLFTEGQDEAQGEEAVDFPILVQLRDTYPDVAKKHEGQVREVQAVQLYLHHFDTEYIGLLNERKMRLDVKFSVERDGFYHVFNNLVRRADSYCVEAERINAGEYTKSYEEDILKRMVEMRHNLFIETSRFFRHIQRFTNDLLQDLDGDAILCQNGDETLSYSDFDRETELRGKTVREGLEQLNQFSSEVIAFLNIPDFG
ncbi:MAG: hypothetical protein GVY29_13190 [Spirochaetes bacterium]|jgi:hypothetical protein|nr:hypothetical protein [Spirochaetota bacterium]